jgi:hypothetical protein
VTSPAPLGLDSLFNSKTSGAHERARTADLVLTKDVLYHLSYVSQSLLLNPTRHRPRHRFFPALAAKAANVNGAGNGIRTRDPQLGRLVL